MELGDGDHHDKWPYYLAFNMIIYAILFFYHTIHT
jgi:hypothetical protein